jgi:hypothetical protein
MQAHGLARVAGHPTIFQSAQNGNSALVLCHLVADADAVNSQDYVNFQRTPLHYSARMRHRQTCNLLLQCNADPNAKNSE